MHLRRRRRQSPRVDTDADRHEIGHFHDPTDNDPDGDVIDYAVRDRHTDQFSERYSNEYPDTFGVSFGFQHANSDPDRYVDPDPDGRALANRLDDPRPE
jgi:hypothetical protein